jgi:hypothetical protein
LGAFPFFCLGCIKIRANICAHQLSTLKEIKMKRTALVAALLALALTACGKKAESTAAVIVAPAPVAAPEAASAPVAAPAAADAMKK